MNKRLKQIVAVFIAFLLPLQGIGAERALGQSMVMPSPLFAPPVLRGIKVDLEDPFHFNFVLDGGHSKLAQQELKNEGEKLIKYFLTSLTLPEDDLWVNLSPAAREKDRIISDQFGQTEMGRQLLSEDYLLKKLSASLLHPDTDSGKKFWNKVRAIAEKKMGVDATAQTFNRIWIMPDKAVVYQDKGVAFIGETHLKVLLEEDYKAFLSSSNAFIGDPQSKNGFPVKDSGNDMSTQVFRSEVLPIIEKEVNEGENFASLRQIYHSLILASWYKRTLKQSVLSQVYVDQKKVAGVESKDKDAKQKIYDEYLTTFKKGVYNLIREEEDQATGEMIPRKYFSGGVTLLVSSSAIEMRPLTASSPIPTVGNLTILNTTAQGLKTPRADSLAGEPQGYSITFDDSIRNLELKEFLTDVAKDVVEHELRLGAQVTGKIINVRFLPEGKKSHKAQFYLISWGNRQYVLKVANAPIAFSYIERHWIALQEIHDPSRDPDIVYPLLKGLIKGPKWTDSWLEGRAYMVMEYVPQKDILDVVKQGGVYSEQNALDFLLKLSRIISRLHKKGIIVADLNLSNIFTKLNGDPVLIDFDVAAVKNKPALDGLSSNVQADIQSLGGALLYLLTEKSYKDGIPDGLKDSLVKDIIAKAISNDVQNQFASVDEMIEALQQARDTMTASSAVKKIDLVALMGPDTRTYQAFKEFNGGQDLKVIQIEAEQKDAERLLTNALLYSKIQDDDLVMLTVRNHFPATPKARETYKYAIVIDKKSKIREKIDWISDGVFGLEMSEFLLQFTVYPSLDRSKVETVGLDRISIGKSEGDHPTAGYFRGRGLGEEMFRRQVELLGGLYSDAIVEVHPQSPDNPTEGYVKKYLVVTPDDRSAQNIWARFRPAAAASSGADVGQGVAAKKYILVVDDLASVRQGVISNLQRNGSRFFYEAASAEEAVELLKAMSAEQRAGIIAVISDFHMGERTGADFLAEDVSNLIPSAKRVLFTGDPSDVRREHWPLMHIISKNGQEGGGYSVLANYIQKVISSFPASSGVTVKNIDLPGIIRGTRTYEAFKAYNGGKDLPVIRVNGNRTEMTQTLKDALQAPPAKDDELVIFAAVIYSPATSDPEAYEHFLLVDTRKNLRKNISYINRAIVSLETFLLTMRFTVYPHSGKPADTGIKLNLLSIGNTPETNAYFRGQGLGEEMFKREAEVLSAVYPRASVWAHPFPSDNPIIRHYYKYYDVIGPPEDGDYYMTFRKSTTSSAVFSLEQLSGPQEWIPPVLAQKIEKELNNGRPLTYLDFEVNDQSGPVQLAARLKGLADDQYVALLVKGEALAGAKTFYVVVDRKDVLLQNLTSLVDVRTGTGMVMTKFFFLQTYRVFPEQKIVQNLLLDFNSYYDSGMEEVATNKNPAFTGLGFFILQSMTRNFKKYFPGYYLLDQPLQEAYAVKAWLDKDFENPGFESGSAEANAVFEKSVTAYTRALGLTSGEGERQYVIKKIPAASSAALNVIQLQSEISYDEIREIGQRYITQAERLQGLDKPTARRHALTPPFDQASTTNSQDIVNQLNFVFAQREKLGLPASPVKADLSGAEVLIVGPGLSRSEVSSFVRAFPGKIKAIHIVDSRRDVMQSLDAELVKYTDQGVELPPIYGYVANMLELPAELKGRMDIVYTNNVVDRNNFTDGQLQQFADEVNGALKMGGVYITAGIFPQWMKEIKSEGLQIGHSYEGTDNVLGFGYAIKTSSASSAVGLISFSLATASGDLEGEFRFNPNLLLGTDMDPHEVYDAEIQSLVPILGEMVKKGVIPARDKKFSIQILTDTAINSVYLVESGGKKYVLKVGKYDEYVKNTQNDWEIINFLNSDGKRPDIAKPVMNGDRFLVTEYLDGQDLSEMINLRMGPMGIARVIDLGIQLSETLGYIHSKGVIVRDITPRNIRIQTNGKVALYDFNVSMTKDYDWEKDPFSLRSSANESWNLNAEDRDVPEHLRARPDVMFDIFSLGMTLLRAQVYNFENAKNVSIRQLLGDVSNPELRKIIEKAISPRDTRYTSTDELKADLIKLQQSFPTASSGVQNVQEIITTVKGPMTINFAVLDSPSSESDRKGRIQSIDVPTLRNIIQRFIGQEIETKAPLSWNETITVDSLSETELDRLFLFTWGEKKYVLKVALTKMQNPFLINEWEILTTLNSPKSRKDIVTPLFVGNEFWFDSDDLTQEQRRFIIVNYLEGEDLAELVRFQSLELSRVVQLGIDLSNTVGYAHDKEIIVRDLKPKNIRILKDGGITLYDFNASVQEEYDWIEDPYGLRWLEVSGLSVEDTDVPLEYREKPDRMFDIYSIGMVLLRSAVNPKYFTREVDIAKAVEAVADSELKRIISKAIGSRTDRYKNINELKADLTKLQKSLPTASSGVNKEEVGGIDLREENLNLDLRGEARLGGQAGTFVLPADPAQIQNIQIDGLVPVILNVTPLPSIPAFLNLSASQSPESAQISLKK